MNQIKQTISIQEALARPKNEPVHVINAYVDSNTHIGGDLFITIRDGNNDVEALRIPSSWVPFEITYVSRKTLLNSSAFRRALNSSPPTLHIASPEYVASLANNTLAQEEYARLRKLEASRNNPRAMEELMNTPPTKHGSLPLTGDTTTEVDVRGSMSVQGPVFDSQETEEVSQNPKAVNNQFKAWAHSLNDFQETESRARLLSRSAMSVAQVEYLVGILIHESIKAKLSSALGKKR